MMKFFRKHNKKMMAILMALLMVVFIGGSALQGMLTPSQDRLIATSAVGDITMLDQQQANRVTSLMLAFNPPMNWRQPIPFGYVDKPLEEIDWILLVREAEKLGMMLDRSTVLASANAENMQNAARMMKRKVSDLIEARTQFDSVRRTALTLAAAAAPSEATVRAVTRDVLETVNVNAVMLPAKMFIDDTREFSEEEMTAQFEEFKNKEKGEGLNFGYYQDPRVKVEFIQINRDKLADLVGIPNLDTRAHKLYDEMVERKDASIKRPAGELAAAGDGPAPSELLSWEEAAEKIKHDLRLKQADQVADRIAGWLIQAAAGDWRESERDESGYRSVPDSVKVGNYYRDLVSRLPQEVNYPTAITVSESNYFTEEAAEDVANIGYTAYRPPRGVSIPFARLAFLNQGVVPKIPSDTTNRGDYTALYETCPYHMTDNIRGHRYVFRVVGAREGRPAESLDEVRDEVIADLRLKAAYDEALAHAESLRSCAVGEGLKEGYDTNLELVALRDTPAGADSGFIEPPAFSRITNKYLAAMGRPKDGVYVSGGLGTLPNWAVDQCFALANAAEHVTILPLPNRADVVVVEFVQVNPPVVEDFLETRESLVGELTAQQWREVLQNWFDPEQIRARNELKFVSR